MTTISAYDPQLNFENLIEQVTLANEPIFISGNNNQTAVLISETMWEEIQERISGKIEGYTFYEVVKN